MFTASARADFPLFSNVFSGLPPRFLGAADGVLGLPDGVGFGVLGFVDGVDNGVLGAVDGVVFGVLGVASPVDLTLGLGRIGSEKKRAGTGFTNVVDQKTAKKMILIWVHV